MKKNYLTMYQPSFIMKNKLLYQFLTLLLIIFFLNLLEARAGNDQSLIQQIKVTGTITDVNRQPIPGVSIVEKGTTNGTISDINGRYSLNINTDKAVLVFSFVGMNTQEISVNNQSTIDIELKAKTIDIEDVVVIGYGKLKSSQVTSSIARVTSDEIDIRPVARIDQAIQGKIAGVRVQELSGSPGRALNVNVRGIGSINFSSSPLYVVDGFPISGDLNSINPGDIESIEVLKDAASAAIYGSRGSNGVILVNTKSGKKGKSFIELNCYFGLQERFSKVDVLNRDEYIEYAIEERINSYIYNGGDLSVPETERHNYKYAIDPLWRTAPESFPDNDWQDLIDQTAPIQSYTLSASGGNDRTKYYITNNYFDQKGIIIHSDYKRYSARANIETKVNDWVSLGINLSIANSKRNDPENDTNQGPIARSILVAPIVGLDQQTINGGYYYYHAHFFLNPVALAKEVIYETKSNNILSNFYGEFSPIKNMVFRASFGADITANKSQYFKANNINRGNGSRAWVSNDLAQNYLSENTLKYDLNRENWTLNLLGGITYQEETYEYSYLYKTGFPDDVIKTLNAGTVINSGTSTEEKWSLISYLARANLSFLDKFMLTSSIRRDGCSRFGKNNRWGVFPSLSMGYIISEEPFIQSIKETLSNLKLRASLGTVGNNNIGNYAAIGLLSSTNYVIGDNTQGGYSPSSFSNSDLGWEKTITTDIGIDMGFINNRINLTFDYYLAKTRDLLLNVPIPQITGFTSSLQNIGRVDNSGYEVEILTKNITKEFKWNTSFNISHNKNEVKELGPDGSPIYGSFTITQIGDAIGSYYLFETDGLFKDQADVDKNKNMAYLSPNPQPGDIKYKDQTNDGKITVDDKKIVGHNIPDFYWGFTNTFNYKGLECSIFLDGQWGNKLLNYAKSQDNQSRGNVQGYWRDRWRSEDNPGNGKVPRAVITENMTTPSDWWLNDASFWRIRNISFGYNLPKKLVSKMQGISSLQINIDVDNIFMHDDYYHMSQTGTYRNTNIEPGIDFDSGYPLARTYKLGINIKF